MRDWLKAAREEKNLTRREMAKALGITESYYGFIEKGVRQQKMDITLVAKLSDVLGIPITEIIRLETPSA